MQVEAVLFDLFDTLLLLERGEVYYQPSLRKLHDFLNKNGVNVPFEDFNRVYFEVREKFYSESRESLEEPHFKVRLLHTLHRLGYDLDVSDPIVIGAATTFGNEFMRYVTIDKDTISVLQNLHGKYKLGLVSNAFIPETVWTLLEKFGLKQFFNVILISGEINRRKPSPEIFEKALKALGVKASKAVFVGDMLDLDVMGPKNVGMKTILIKRRPTEGIDEVKPDKIIKTLNDLLGVLANC
jgi:HAD superfamily hydrolase (TIGR01509 family)